MPGATSANVTTAPITVPTNSLLLSWVKNETSATATAPEWIYPGYTVDQLSCGQSRESPISAGSYTGDFQYRLGDWVADGHRRPEALARTSGSEPSGYDKPNTPVGITLTATSPQGLPLTYTVLSGPTQGHAIRFCSESDLHPNPGYVGPDAFTFSASDGTTNSNTANISITVRGPSTIHS